MFYSMLLETRLSKYVNAVWAEPEMRVLVAAINEHARGVRVVP